ncbi:MAG: ABC transporter substrate-binding protein [Chloroflexi bacterium]|nr:ABC transporter substrate-binding protein [Chloroflexota bacterium]
MRRGGPTRRAALRALATAGLGLLLGCSPPRSPAPGPRPTAAPPSRGGASRPTPTAASLRPVPRNHTLITAGVGGEAPVRFEDVSLQNPFLPGITRSGYQVVMEPLFYYNAYHTSTVCGPSWAIGCTDGEIPWLAVSYQYGYDYRSLVISLRDGVTWSDGRPFTARDVIFTIEMLRDSAPDLTWSTDMRQWVQDATALDEHTVLINLTAPNPRFMLAYFMHHQDFGIPIVPEHVFRGQDPRTFTNAAPDRGWPVVTGPYRLIYSDPTRKVWDRRDDWWGAVTGFHPLPVPERLIFLPGADEATLADLIIRNEVDTTLNLSIPNIRRVLAANPRITTWTDARPPYGYVDYWLTGLGFNDTIAPFSDPDIRWAINFAINRDELVGVGYQGAGAVALLPLIDYPALRPYAAAVADLLQRYPVGRFDPQRSAQILLSKGYTRDPAGFWTRNGQRFTLPIVTYSVEEDIARVLVSQLRRAGFDATLTLPPDFLTRIYTGQAPVYVFGHAGGVRDPYFTLRIYQSRYSAPTGQRAVQPYRWRNDQFDALVDQMATVAPSDPRLQSLFHAAMEIWLRELPDIPLVQYYHRIPVSTAYWTGWPNEANPYINLANWHRTFELIVLSLRPS